MGSTSETTSLDRVRAIITDQLHIDVFDDHTNLIDSGLIDSMSLVELFMILDEDLGVSVANEDLDLDDFRTVDSIARFVDRHLRATP